MLKKIICALTVTVALGSQLCAAAFGGGYPAHPVNNPPVKEQESSSKNCWTPSDAENMFTVGGKRFVLLDTDSEGNYFVITEDEYGKYPYSTQYQQRQTIETKITSGGEVSYVPGAAADMDDRAWSYDPENPTSIGYWLNTEFLENGNGSSFVLPDEIKEGLIEKEWPIEGYKPINCWNVAQYTGDKTHADDYANNHYQEGYTVGGKLSLLSYTEYKTYENIIGWTYCSSGWDGFMLRTPYALITGETNKLTCVFGSMQVKNQSASADTSKKMIIAGNDTPDVANFYVRPVMWLDKDFFANTRVDLESAGYIVKSEIIKNTMASLSGIYSDDELMELGFDIESAPKIENAYISGTPAKDAIVYADYGYISSVGANEKNSVIDWYISDTKDGEYTALGVSGKTVKLGSDMTGKYLKYRIMPKDASNRGGKYYWSSPSSAVTEMDIPVVSNVDIVSSSMGITVKNNAGESKNVKILKAVYDSNNKLVSVIGTDPVSINANEAFTQNMDISEKDYGLKISVMVWIEDSQPVFYMKF